MLNPDLRNVLKDKTSRYSLVIATAKRAREIAEDAEIVENENEAEDGEIIANASGPEGRKFARLIA